MKALLKLSFIVGAIAACAVSFGAAPASAQASKCPALSEVEWWTNTVPEVRRVVTASYNGSWDAYIDRWKQQYKDLQAAYDAGNQVEIKSRNLIFRGDELKDYIGLVEERISTLQCLKREFASADAAAASQPNLPSNGQPKQELSAPQEVKAIEGKELDLEVAAICEGRVPAFQVTNLGERWPRLAEISLYRTDTNGMVTQRRLRMTNSQQMIFKLPEELAKDGAEIGIFVQPSWYERTFQYDAKIRCQ